MQKIIEQLKKEIINAEEAIVRFNQEALVYEDKAKQLRQRVKKLESV